MSAAPSTAPPVSGIPFVNMVDPAPATRVSEPRTMAVRADEPELVPGTRRGRWEAVNHEKGAGQEDVGVTRWLVYGEAPLRGLELGSEPGCLIQNALNQAVDLPPRRLVRQARPHRKVAMAPSGFRRSLGTTAPGAGYPVTTSITGRSWAGAPALR